MESHKTPWFQTTNQPLKSPLNHQWKKKHQNAPNHQPVIGMHWDTLKLALIYAIFEWMTLIQATEN